MIVLKRKQSLIISLEVHLMDYIEHTGTEDLVFFLILWEKRF